LAGKITNRNKWFIAFIFVFLVAFAAPTWVAQDWAWFSHDWGASVYVVLTAGMWLAATGFVDVDKPRGAPDLANRLIPLGLILAVPVAVWDWSVGFARSLPDRLANLAVGLGLCAIVLGFSARAALGQAYSPRGATQEQSRLVRVGPYRLVRHPLYLAALLWCAGWPLLIKSLVGALTALVFVLPAIWVRIRAEEQELIRVFGEAYREYQDKTWRLIPWIY